MASTTILMPTKSTSGATGKTPQKTTSSELHVKKKKLRNMVVPAIDDEEEEQYEQPLIKRKKVVNKDALNIPTKDVQEGARLISIDLLTKSMEKPSISKALLKHVEDEVMKKED